jgi:hypothetical protein
MQIQEEMKMENWILQLICTLGQFWRLEIFFFWLSTEREGRTQREGEKSQRERDI